MRKPREGFFPQEMLERFDFHVPTLVVHAMLVVGRVRDAAVEKALRRLNLSLTRYRALWAIDRLQSCAMSELAITIATDRTSLSRAVDQLVGAGLVERLVYPQDRRTVLIKLTEPGEVVLSQATAVVDGFNSRCMAGIPPDIQSTMLQGLKGMLGNLGTTAQDINEVFNKRLAETR